MNLDGHLLRYETSRIIPRMETEMTNDRQIVDMIERANDADPYCSCGSHNTPVWRDGAVWLECASLTEPRQGRVARFLAAVSVSAHERARIVDVPSMAPSS